MNLIWYTYFGSAQSEFPRDMSILADGSIVVVGSASPQTGLYYPGGLPLSTGVGFILRMDQNGNRIWSSYFYQGTAISRVTPLVNGDFIVAGSANDNSNIATPGSQQTSSAGGGDIFLTRITPSGEVVWSRYFGGPDEESLNAMVYDGGYIYCAGNTRSNSGIAFNTTEGGTFIGGDFDALLVKFDEDGNVIKSRYFGGEGFDSFNGIAAANGSLALTGRSDSASGINHGSHILLDGPEPDNATFIASFSDDLEIQWSTYHDQDGSTLDILIDTYNRVWVSGRTSSVTDFEFGSGTTHGGDADGFIARFQPNGELEMCGYYFSAELNDQINSLDSDGTNLFVAGLTLSQDLTVSEDAWQPEHAGSSDGLIMRFALPVGVDEMADLSVSPVYPNPAVDQLTIPASAMTGVQELHVCDLTGRSVLHQSAHLPGVATLHITSLQPGMYTIRAHNAAGQAVWVQRWVKG
ncbi:MAG: T9SS type A sorting domain-containing protein [Flavobacteriales bacterium]